MTTEEDFQAMLDANPDDWQTRLIFADWLQDRDDPRAEGYRALGKRRLVPIVSPTTSCYLREIDNSNSHIGKHFLPEDWHIGVGNWKVYPSRRVAEDAAALAFAKLSASRRAELLSAPLTSST